MKTNKTLLALIVLLLAGILAVLIYDATRPKTASEKIEAALSDAGNDIGDALEDLGDDIQKSNR